MCIFVYMCTPYSTSTFCSQQVLIIRECNKAHNLSVWNFVFPLISYSLPFSPFMFEIRYKNMHKTRPETRYFSFFFETMHKTVILYHAKKWGNLTKDTINTRCFIRAEHELFRDQPIGEVRVSNPSATNGDGR